MASNTAILKVTSVTNVTIVGPKASSIAAFIADKIISTEDDFSGDNLVSLDDLGDTTRTFEAEVV